MPDVRGDWRPVVAGPAFLYRKSFWLLGRETTRHAVALADRHYSRKTPGSDRFCGPGRKLVLLAADATALWASAAPRFVDREVLPLAWVCTIFRNEGGQLASELIKQAVATTRYEWGEPPADGMVTFVDVSKVKPKKTPGYCYVRAGFREAGHTKSGHLVLHLRAEDFPAPMRPANYMVPGPAWACPDCPNATVRRICGCGARLCRYCAPNHTCQQVTATRPDGPLRPPA